MGTYHVLCQALGFKVFAWTLDGAVGEVGGVADAGELPVYQNLGS
jgi:hypothetical protein